MLGDGGGVLEGVRRRRGQEVGGGGGRGASDREKKRGEAYICKPPRLKTAPSGAVGQGNPHIMGKWIITQRMKIQRIIAAPGSKIINALFMKFFMALS